MYVDFIVQFLATVLLLAGLWVTGDRKLRGPFMCFLAEAFTTVVGIQHHVWSIIVIGAVLFFVQLRNFFKWRSEGLPW